MNPLTNIKNTQELNKKELELGLIGKKSWHDKYKDSAWVFLGGLPYELTEGDVICVFSQYGEVVNVNLVRDKQSGKFKGFGFLCYEDQRSTVLAVDNLNGFNLLNRTIRVDHVEGYRQPKEHGDEDEVTQKLRAEGCAPKVADDDEDDEEEDDFVLPIKKEKKEKHKKSKKKKEKKKKKKKEKNFESDSSNSDENSTDDDKTHVQIKAEKVDRAYDKALTYSGQSHSKRHEAPFSGSRTNKDTVDGRSNNRQRLEERGPKDRERKYNNERERGRREKETDIDFGRQQVNKDDQFINGRERKTGERTNDGVRGKGRDEWMREQGRDGYGEREWDRDRERYGERERRRQDVRKRDRSDDRLADENRKRFHDERTRSNDRYRDNESDYRRHR
ncbi:RNA-binding motif protein, X-linked 2-like [Ylistrum balloti]|uniref:RNA-binding motif protein, X-linked 2-like n=1 Tax=Ylistrum balloti TaxID=509963 RepID=UPI002905BB17|nr:RNA-binding motif protein, X-linked 2-like [Ylistrum balloti]